MNSQPLKIRLFGTLEVVRGDKPLVFSSRSAQALLAYLLLKPGTQHRREKLAAIIWPQASEENSRAYLRNTLWELRKVAGETFFLADKNLVGISSTAHYGLDVDRLTGLKDKQASVAELKEVLELYRGELLADFYDDWIVTEREHFNRLYVSHYMELLGTLQIENRWQEAIEWGEKLIRNAEAPEKAFRLLMNAYAEAGDISNVTSVYQRTIRFLKQHLDIAPSPETEDLYQSLIHKKRAGLSAKMPQTTVLSKRSQPTKRSRYWILLAGLLGAMSFSLFVFNNGNLGIQTQASQENEGLVVQAAGLLTSSDLPLIARRPLFVPLEARKELRLAPDGTIRIASIDGLRYDELKPANLYVMGASWLADGKRVLFWGDPRGDMSWQGWGNFYVVNEDGTELIQLTPDEDNTILKGRPSLSSDGTRILYSDGGGIAILNLLDGSLQNVVTTDNGLSWIPDAKWSPDNSKVVFLRITPNCNCPRIIRITVVNSDGTDPKVIYTSPLGYDIIFDSVGFSPDGTQVGFMGRTDATQNEYQAYTVDIDGESPPQITNIDVWTWLPTYYPQWGE